MKRIVLFGNSGSGKTTLARALAEESNCSHMDLDTIAWEPTIETPTRRPLNEARADILDFVNKEQSWVIEGCYTDLLEVAAAYATEIIFLNPGIETSIENARGRPWEPHKYSTPAAQDANLEMLVAWIKDYDKRTDDFSYSAHRKLFDAFSGRKQELLSNERS